jgi:hypothetical protein
MRWQFQGGLAALKGSYELQQAEAASLSSERSQLYPQYVATADALQRAAKETAASKQIGPHRWQLTLQNWCGKTISRSNLPS